MGDIAEQANARPASAIDRYMPSRRHSYGPETSSLIDFNWIRAFLWRQRYILIGLTVLAFLVGLVATMLMTPTYQASATVRVNTSNGSSIVEGQEIVETFVRGNEIDRYLLTLSEVIRSRSMAGTVVDALDLQNSEALLGEAVAEGQPAGVSAEDWAASKRAMAIGILNSSVSVDIPIETRIMEIRFVSQDPSLAARIANGYAEQFVNYNVSESVEANSYAREFLEEQIAEVQARLRDAEVQAIAYARANRIIGGSTASAESDENVGTAPTLTVSNVAVLNQAYSEARAARVAAEQRWRAIASIPAAQLPEVQQNASIQSLRTQQGQLEARLADLRQRYQDDYPEVREVTAELSSLRSQADAASESIKQSIQSEYLIAQREEQALQREVTNVSDDALNEQDRRVQYNLINREVEAARNQLGLLLNRYNQITSASNLRSNIVTPLDSATVPGRPYSPNIMRNLLIALVLGFGLACGLALLREIIDDRVRSLDDVEQKLSLPGIGQTPFVGDEVDNEVDDPFSPLAEAYSSIRATLDFALLNNDCPILQITSSKAGEGKSVTSAVLSRKFASVGKKVLLMDLDLRRGVVAKSFNGKSSKSGLVDVLFGRVPFEQALLEGTPENLDVLPTGPFPPNPVEILASGLLPEFFAQQRANYDIIILDSSPVMGIADAPIISQMADAVVFVVEANLAHFGQARSAVRRLRDVNANIVGAILTKYRALEAGQDYSYQYQYYSYSSKE